MSDKPIHGFHIVRFGIAGDQQFLLGNFLNTYDQLIINANIVAHMPAALTSFLLMKAKNKPYFVDPQTHAFQHDIDHIQSGKTGEVRRSIKKLAEYFGKPVITCVEEKRPLEPIDFRNDKITLDYCDNVLKFQEEAISKEATKSDAAKYYKFAHDEHGLKLKKMFHPTLLVAPYFYLDLGDSFDGWLQVNLRCATMSKKISNKTGLPLAVQIVISRELLYDKTRIKKIVDGYRKTNADIFLIWIDSFAENEASQQDLLAYIDFLKQLNDIAPLVNLYGGFFSIILGKCNIVNNLVGVAHSLEYGESRSVVPVGGGLPTAKFYFPSLHSRLLFRDALRAVKAVGGDKDVKSFRENVCDCSMCKKVIKNKPESDFGIYGESKPIQIKRGGQNITIEYPLTETKEKTVSHYMWTKQKEYRQSYSLEGTISALKSTHDKLGSIIRLRSVGHCGTWANVLETCSQ